jgi:hypothetical protein
MLFLFKVIYLLCVSFHFVYTFKIIFKFSKHTNMLSYKDALNCTQFRTAAYQSVIV